MAYRFNHWRLWNTGSSAFADDDDGIRLCILATHYARGLLETVPRKSEGAGNAGCRLHPRSRVQDALENAHTSIQVQPEQPGIPCTVVLRLMPSSPRRRIPLASVASELTVRIARLSFANLRRLDASHGRQDHTVLPYAASTAKNFNQPSAGQPKIWRKRLSAVRLRAMFTHGKPALRTSFAPDAAASTATRPNVRDDGQRPSSRDGMAGVVRVIWGRGEADYFCVRGWTAQITLKLLRKIARPRTPPPGNATKPISDQNSVGGLQRNSFAVRPKWIRSVSGGNLLRPVLSCSPVTPAQLLTAGV